MIRKVILFFIYSAFLSYHIKAQSFIPDYSIPITINGNLLINPWAGGINNPQFSEIDLDGNGIKDLFVFEKNLSRISTFINYGTPSQIDYHFAPQYISKFPSPLGNIYTLLVDYDCDGKEDIFTYGNSNWMSVYKNNYSVGSGLQFNLTASTVISSYSGSPNTLKTNSTHLPAIIDIDNDGDIDILYIQSSLLDDIHIHKNLSVENWGNCDSLNYYTDGNSWGGIGFSVSYNGVNFVLALDNDNDNDYDIITDGNLNSPDSLWYLENIGSLTSPSLIISDKNFPSYNIPAYLQHFLAAYNFDVNNDNKKDLLVANCSIIVKTQKILCYENTTSGASTFNFLTDGFLINGMIDVGYISNVKFFDADNDGLQDLLIGNYFTPSENIGGGGDTAYIYYFRNVGTALNPSFQLITQNFANAAKVYPPNLVPAFGDLDGDGDNDMLIGDRNGYLTFYTNIAGPGNPCNFVFTANNYQNIDVGDYCAPQIFDINQDLKPDLICGNRDGKIQYFENTGTITNPVFTLMNPFWGSVIVADTAIQGWGLSYPFIYENNGSLELLVGSFSGYIFKYINITGNINGVFTLSDSTFGDIYEPGMVTVSGTDINGDGAMDIVIGNATGGARIYKQTLTNINQNLFNNNNINIRPNPTNDYITIQYNLTSPKESSVLVFNIYGQTVKPLTPKGGLQNAGKQEMKIDIKDLPQGIYFVKVSVDGKEEVRKVVKY